MRVGAIAFAAFCMMIALVLTPLAAGVFLSTSGGQTNTSGLTPDGTDVYRDLGINGVAQTKWGQLTLGYQYSPADWWPKMNGRMMNIANATHCLNVQIWNGGEVWCHGSEGAWGAWGSYKWVNGNGVTPPISCFDTTVFPFPSPPYNPPYIPSPDTTDSVAPGGASVTTADGVYSWFFFTAGSYNAMKLNGVPIGPSGGEATCGISSSGVINASDEMQVNSHGQLFFRSGSNWYYYTGFQANPIPAPTSSPVIVDVHFIPVPSSQGWPQISVSSPIGTPTMTPVVTLSDGTVYTGSAFPGTATTSCPPAPGGPNTICIGLSTQTGLQEEVWDPTSGNILTNVTFPSTTLFTSANFTFSINGGTFTEVVTCQIR